MTAIFLVSPCVEVAASWAYLEEKEKRVGKQGFEQRAL